MSQKICYGTFLDKTSSNEEYLDWIRQSMKYVPDLQEELNLYNFYVQEVERCVAEYQKLDEQVDQEQARLTELQSSKYSAEVKRAVRYLLEKTEEYTVSNTFKMIFDHLNLDGLLRLLVVE